MVTLRVAASDVSHQSGKGSPLALYVQMDGEWFRPSQGSLQANQDFRFLW